MFALLLTAHSTAAQLDPPAGPIVKTGKTLTEVEPRIPINLVNTPGDADSLFKITQPGSYYLTGNITGVAGKHGIEIVVSGVTLDLNGFDLAGVSGMGDFDGILITAPSITNTTVRNGSVRDWGGDGVNLGIPFLAYSQAVVDIHASGNAGDGIIVSNGSIVTRCTAYNNAGNGISAYRSCTISESTAYENTGNGIDGITGCTIVACTAAFNAGNGITTLAGSTISECSASFNTGNGIDASGSYIVGNTCRGNGFGGDGAGIRVNFDESRIEGNNCTDNDRGIDVDSAGNLIIKNSCSDNSTNWDIVAGNSYLIVQATATASNFTGNAGGGGVGSTDPNANFTY